MWWKKKIVERKFGDFRKGIEYMDYLESMEIYRRNVVNINSDIKTRVPVNLEDPKDIAQEQECMDDFKKRVLLFEDCFQSAYKKARDIEDEYGYEYNNRRKYGYRGFACGAERVLKVFDEIKQDTLEKFK